MSRQHLNGRTSETKDATVHPRYRVNVQSLTLAKGLTLRRRATMRARTSDLLLAHDDTGVEIVTEPVLSVGNKRLAAPLVHYQFVVSERDSLASLTFDKSSLIASTSPEWTSSFLSYERTLRFRFPLRDFFKSSDMLL